MNMPPRALAAFLPPSFLAVLSALLTLPLLAGPAWSQGAEFLVGGSVKPVLESLKLENLDGEVQPLSTYLEDGPLLIDFWATWCKPCLVALPELQQLYTDLSEHGLQMLGINEDGPRNASKVKPFIRSHGYTFPVVLDLNREAQRRLNALTLPTTLLLDREGTVVHASFGFRKGETEQLRAKIEELLAVEADE
jgi:thiol-disulfide isomerase/thioredoxin